MSTPPTPFPKRQTSLTYGGMEESTVRKPKYTKILLCPPQPLHTEYFFQAFT